MAVQATLIHQAQINRLVERIVKEGITDAFIDLFCGAGGVTEAIEGTEKAIVVACINHWPVALTTHRFNHPDAIHCEEDIRTVDIAPIAHLVRYLRKLFPYLKIHLWASLECTNFSKAKGGLPRDADSRTLANDLERYIEALRPDKIWIENVTEFMAWGPLDHTGRPLSMHSGEDYIKWVSTVKGYGYDYSHRILNAADFGAYTSRKRYFAQFSAPDMSTEWPEVTHHKRGKKSQGKQTWNAVRDVLDLNDHGISIFGRKKNLSDNTYKRIYYGLVKFIAGGSEDFLLNYHHSSNANSTFDPSPTLTTKDKFAYITTYHGNGNNLHSVEGPSPTVATKDNISLIQAEPFILRDFSNGGQYNDINGPAGSVLSSPKLNLVSAIQYDPATLPVRGANGRDYFLLNPQWGIQPHSINKPCFTLIARMDKTPPYFITTESGEPAIVVEKGDTPYMIKIKQFMAHFGLMDIKMRMLQIKELLRIQGFPETYYLFGNQAQQKKQLGNSVEVRCVRAMINCNIDKRTRWAA